MYSYYEFYHRIHCGALPGTAVCRDGGRPCKRKWAALNVKFGAPYSSRAQSYGSLIFFSAEFSGIYENVLRPKVMRLWESYSTHNSASHRENRVNSAFWNTFRILIHQIWADLLPLWHEFFLSHTIYILFVRCHQHDCFYTIAAIQLRNRHLSRWY